MRLEIIWSTFIKDEINSHKEHKYNHQQKMPTVRINSSYKSARRFLPFLFETTKDAYFHLDKIKATLV